MAKLLINKAPDHTYTIKILYGTAQRNRSQIRLAVPPASTENTPAYATATQNTAEYAPITPPPLSRKPAPGRAFY